MATSTNYNKTPIISKMYCSTSQVVFYVRKRPHVTNGGGFVVTDCSQQVVFRVDGCGILGKKDELLLRNAEGCPLLLVRRKGGMMEALSIHKKWQGYNSDYQGSSNPVFVVKQRNSCFRSNSSMKIQAQPKECSTSSDFEIKGYFPDKDCSIIDANGNVIAQVGVWKDVEELMTSKDVYHVVVKPGIDQAFVFGVIAVLDYIYGESTTC